MLFSNAKTQGKAKRRSQKYENRRFFAPMFLLESFFEERPTNAEITHVSSLLQLFDSGGLSANREFKK